MGRTVEESMSAATRALLESFSIFRRPPIAQISLRVELASLIVETVGQFVTDHGADAKSGKAPWPKRTLELVAFLFRRGDKRVDALGAK